MNRKPDKYLIVVILTAVYIFLSGIESSAQEKKSTISGNVREKETNIPLLNVNVFVSGTTLGAATDANGHFEILNVPEGNHNIVASIIGYQPEVQKIEIEGRAKYSLNFRLEQKAYEFGTVEVTGKVSEDWKDNLDIFKKFFLGVTPFNNNCVIENDYKIDFKKKPNGDMDARCPEPIRVVNNALGYRLDCVLLQFTCNNENGSVKYLYYPKFYELTTEDESIKEKWVQNRYFSYLRSLNRFLKSLISYKAYDDGYLLGPGFVSNRDLVKYSQDDNGYILSFSKYLFVDNRRTGERGWLYLPFHSAVIDKFGFPISPNSILAFGSFAENGIANLVPENYHYSE